jgi:hypothetical protein
MEKKMLHMREVLFKLYLIICIKLDMRGALVAL